MNKTQILSKFGKLFAASHEPAGVLQGIHYAADGSAIVTNRQYLLRIRDAHSFGHPITLHAKTGSPIGDLYPDTSRAWPSSHAAEMPLFAPGHVVDRIAAATAVAKTLNKTLPILRLEERNGSMHAVVTDDAKLIECRAFVGNPSRAGSSVRKVNADYLLTALRVFREANHDCVMHFSRPNDPIVLAGGDIDVLILPFRTAPEEGEVRQ